MSLSRFSSSGSRGLKQNILTLANIISLNNSLSYDVCRKIYLAHGFGGPDGPVSPGPWGRSNESSKIDVSASW